MPYPTERVVELVAPERYALKLTEPPVPQDPDSTDAGALPTFNAYSADGDVTAELVYVNYGTPEDYEQLAKLGVDVKGKIVIARYGRSWRGIKPKVAYEHGAVGCIIYSDPHEDGFFPGDVYPDGRYRPEMGAQRGSVMDMPIHPGDPLTPGTASEAGRAAPRSRRVADDPEDSGAADLLRRRAAAAAQPQGTGRARRLARRAADHVSRRRRPGEGPPEAGVRLEHPSALRRHRPHRRIRVSRRVDRPRQPSRRVGQRRRRSDQRQRRADGDRARPRRAAEERLAAEADDHPRVVGRRGVGTARIDRVGREARAGAVDQGGRLHQQRQHVEGMAERLRLAFAAGVRQRPDARHPGSEARRSKTPLPGEGRSRAQPGDDRRRRRRAIAAAPRLPDRRARLRIRLHRVPRSPDDRVAEPGLRRRGRRTPASITRPTTRSTGTRTSPTPTSPTARRCRGRSARPSCGSPTPTSCRSSSPRRRRRCAATRTRSTSWEGRRRMRRRSS